VSATAGAASSSTLASSTSGSGNALDTTVYDDGDQDATAVASRSDLFGSDSSPGGEQASGSDSRTRTGRFHETNEKDRIRNNISGK
jgi:hypothetical protein